MERTMVISSLEEMCDLMCGGVEDMESRYLIIDNRLGRSEQDTTEYTLDELKEYFKIDLNKCNDEDIEYFKLYNNDIDNAMDIYDLQLEIHKYDEQYFTFIEVE